MKLARARKRRKPLSERHQTMIACSACALLIAGVVGFFGYVVPPKTQSAMVIPAADTAKPVKPVNSSLRGPR